MQKRTYEAPHLIILGTVRELTELTSDKCTGSADAVLPRNPPPVGDFSCGDDAAGGGL